MEPLITQFKQFYSDLTRLPTAKFDQIYADDVIFRDPVHQLRGGAELMAYLEPLCEKLEYGHFEYLDQLVQGDTAYIKWNMHFRHPRLGDRTVCVRGMSHLQFTDRVYFHEDSYDLGALIYEQLPLMGSLTRWFKRRLQ